MYKYNWEDFKIEDIVGGVAPDGVRFLKLFLTDYTALFSEVVNPGCNKCLANYLQKYKSKIFEMENNSQYRLKEKYNGLSLSFGSSIMVHNGNITNEYAEELLQRFSAETIFDVFPVVEVEKQNTFEATETPSKSKRKRISKK
jgi:hypothetical protein